MAETNQILQPRALALARKLQLTEIELAKETGMHVQTARRFMRGDHVHANTIRKILRTLEAIETHGTAAWRAKAWFGNRNDADADPTAESAFDAVMKCVDMVYSLARSATRNDIQVSQEELDQLNGAIKMLVSNADNIPAKTRSD
ncbi:MAG: hypothetical protein V3U96_01065 [Paracoccaceae bacterium]